MSTFKLDKIPKIETGFVVPKNYFDNFEEKILLEISKPEVKVVSIFRKRITLITAIAAVFVIGFSITIFVNNQNATELTNQEYLVTHENLNVEDFAEILMENEIKSLENSLNTYDLETINSVKQNL